jgi:hypothetical protein
MAAARMFLGLGEGKTREPVGFADVIGRAKGIKSLFRVGAGAGLSPSSRRRRVVADDLTSANNDLLR